MADYPGWQKTIREAQTAQREAEAQKKAQEDAEIAAKEKIKGKYLKAALDMLGIEVEPPDKNEVVLDPVRFWIEAPQTDDTGTLVKFTLHIRYALPYAWSELSEYQFYHSWRNYTCEVRYNNGDYWHKDIDKVKAAVADAVDGIVSYIGKDLERYNQYLSKKEKESIAQVSPVDAFLELLREIVREEMANQ